jgi:WXG100 family type VII secretion target
MPRDISAPDRGAPGSDDLIDVTPEVMQGTSQALTAAAEHLQTGLKDLESEVVRVLAQWQGSAGGSYAEAWQQWHVGAQEVQSALARISAWVAAAGREFEATDGASAQIIDGVHRG